MPTITIQDQTTSGKKLGELTLDVLTERITVRELIRARVYQEVEDFNQRQRAEAGAAATGELTFRGLVQPTETEATLNGYRMKRVREVDWKAQFEKACEVFERNGFLVLVDERQVEGLDEEVVLGATSTVTFLKMVPLVGG